jgi:hypothetical protein
MRQAVNNYGSDLQVRAVEPMACKFILPTVAAQRSLLLIPNPDTSPLIRSKVFHCVARDEPGKPGEESGRDPLDDGKHNILLLVQIGPILSEYRRQSSDSHCPSIIFNVTQGRFVRTKPEEIAICKDSSPLLDLYCR